MAGRLKAFILLGWAFLTTVLRLLWPRRRQGLEQFRENYAADGLPPVSPRERAIMASFGRCIACGLCDVDDQQRIARAGGRYRSTMSLVLAASRSMPDFRAAAAGFQVLDEQALREKEAVCPTNVPIGALARFVRDHADEARVPSTAPPSEQTGLPSAENVEASLHA